MLSAYALQNDVAGDEMRVIYEEKCFCTKIVVSLMRRRKMSGNVFHGKFIVSAKKVCLLKR